MTQDGTCRMVGIMYSVWHDEFLQPQQLTQGKPWMHRKPFGPCSVGHWWGVPKVCGSAENIPSAYRFVKSDGKPNKDLIDYHAKLLTAAGVDFIFIDLTNGEQERIMNAAHAVCQRYTRLVKEGERVPRIVMWCMRPEATRIMHDRFYANPAFDKRVFFEWEGKPLMLVRPFPEVDSKLDTAKLPRGYTYRSMWALLPDPSSMWSFRNVTLPYKGYKKSGELEQMPVAFASQKYHMHNDVDARMEEGRRGRCNGDFFKQCFDLVMQGKPRVMTVSTWNEWLSQNICDRKGKGIFTDIYGPEYSHDCEPSVEHGSTFYDMLVAAVKKFKALR